MKNSRNSIIDDDEDEDIKRWKIWYIILYSIYSIVYSIVYTYIDDYKKLEKNLKSICW